MNISQPTKYRPFHVFGQERSGRWIIICDHATNTVPFEIGGGTLGLRQEDMDRHIAYDVGAAGVALELADLLESPAILTNFSRLVIDPNRGEDDPTLLMKLYDGTIIPANRFADATEKERRLEAYYRPYHDALAELISSRPAPNILSVHSYTPQLNGGPPRPWHIGLLFADDTRLAAPLLDALGTESDLCVGTNEPYGGHLAGDTIDRHAIANGHPNILVEIRNDYIQSDRQQVDWATRLAPILEQVLEVADL